MEVEPDLVQDCEDEDDGHYDSLRIARNFIVYIAYQEEKTNEADFHEVETGEELVDCAGEEEASAIHVACSNAVE